MKLYAIFPQNFTISKQQKVKNNEIKSGKKMKAQIQKTLNGSAARE